MSVSFVVLLVNNAPRDLASCDLWSSMDQYKSLFIYIIVPQLEENSKESPSDGYLDKWRHHVSWYHMEIQKKLLCQIFRETMKN